MQTSAVVFLLLMVTRSVDTSRQSRTDARETYHVDSQTDQRTGDSGTGRSIQVLVDAFQVDGNTDINEDTNDVVLALYPTRFQGGSVGSDISDDSNGRRTVYHQRPRPRYSNFRGRNDGGQNAESDSRDSRHSSESSDNSDSDDSGARRYRNHRTNRRRYSDDNGSEEDITRLRDNERSYNRRQSVTDRPSYRRGGRARRLAGFEAVTERQALRSNRLPRNK